jgi:hypothetical protein
MAAVLAHQHAGLWHRRPEDSFHVPELHFTSMMPSYNTQRGAINAPALRNYQPPTTHMDISLPLFTPNVLATTVSYPSSGAFAYDSSVNPYNMQQNNLPHSYPMSYPTNLAPAASYAERPAPQPLSTVRDTHHAFSLDGSHMVKSESASPVQSNSMFNDASYATDCKRSSSEPAEATDINFATDVDTLMKAIQAKQTTSSPKREPVKVSTNFKTLLLVILIHSSTKRPRFPRSLENATSVACQIATRASTRKHIWRFTSGLTLARNHLYVLPSSSASVAHSAPRNVRHQAADRGSHN